MRMMGLITFILATLLLTSNKRSFLQAKKISHQEFVIKTRFINSKKIWGAYKNVREEIVNTSEGKTLSAKKSLSNLVFDKRKMIIVRPLQKNEFTNFETASFDYEIVKKNTKEIENSKTNKKAVIALYKDHIVKIISSVPSLKDRPINEALENVSLTGFKCINNFNKADCELKLNVATPN